MMLSFGSRGVSQLMRMVILYSDCIGSNMALSVRTVALRFWTGVEAGGKEGGKREGGRDKDRVKSTHQSCHMAYPPTF